MTGSIGDKIFKYSVSELEDKAERFMRTMPSVSDSPPIAPEVILDRLPEVKKVEVLPLLVEKYGVEGMVLAPRFMHRDLTVVIDQGVMNDRDPSRYNMTIAEEIGHILLHRAVMLEIRDYDDFAILQSHQNWNIAERDAKYWARALLMPRLALEEEAFRIYRRVAHESGFGDAFAFRSVFLSHLSSIFEVPLRDVQKRIDGYIGDISGRLDRSIAARSDSLLSTVDYLLVADKETSRRIKSDSLKSRRGS